MYYRNFFFFFWQLLKKSSRCTQPGEPTSKPLRPGLGQPGREGLICCLAAVRPKVWDLETFSELKEVTILLRPQEKCTEREPPPVRRMLYLLGRGECADAEPDWDSALPLRSRVAGTKTLPCTKAFFSREWLP